MKGAAHTLGFALALAGACAGPASDSTPPVAGSAASAGSLGGSGTAGAGTSGGAGGGSAASPSAGTSGIAAAGAGSSGVAAAGSAGSLAGSSGSSSAGSAGSSAIGADGGLPDAGPPAASACPRGAFCDDFDATAGALVPARWSTVMPNCSGTGEVAIDEQLGHSGTRSLRVRGAGGYCNHVFAAPSASALPLAGPLHVRFYVRFEKPLGAAHVTFVTLHDKHEGKDLRVGGQSEILMWNRESDDATLPELSPTGIGLSVKPKPETWLCVELQIDPAARSLRTWIDGKEVAGLIVDGEPTPDVDRQWKNKPDWAPVLEDLKLGWESYGNDANTLWFDDLVVAGTRVGCGR